MGIPARKYNINIFEEARNAISILSVLERYGFPLKRVGLSWRSSRCPVCGQSPDPNSVRLVVFEDTNSWYCHRCGNRGDVISAVAEIEGISPFEAAQEILNNGWPRVKLRVVKSAEQVKKKRAETTLAKAAVVSMLLRIATAKNPEGLGYLVRERKIPHRVVQEALKQKLLAFLPGFFQIKEEINKIPSELLKKAGFLRKKDETEAARNVLPFIVGKRPIICPFNLSLSFPVGAEFRAAKAGIDPKAITIGTKGFWFWPGQNNNLLLTEGIIDLLSAVALGWKGPILGLPGVQDIKRIPAEFWKSYEVWLALDGDEAGREMTSWAISQGVGKYVFQLPEGKDLNDLLRGGLTSFKDLPWRK